MVIVVCASVIAAFCISAISLMLVCVIAAIWNLSWKEVFSKKLIAESIENFKLAWSVKLFTGISMLYALVFALYMCDAYDKHLTSKYGQCTCKCKACKLSIEKIRMIEETLGISTNEFEKTSINSNEVETVSAEAK